MNIGKYCHNEAKTYFLVKYIMQVSFIVYQYNVLQGYFGTFRGISVSSWGISVYQGYSQFRSVNHSEISDQSDLC